MKYFFFVAQVKVIKSKIWLNQTEFYQIIKWFNDNTNEEHEFDYAISQISQILDIKANWWHGAEP